MFQGRRGGSDEIFSGKNFPFLINIILIAHFYASCPCVFLPKIRSTFYRAKSVFISFKPGVS